MSEEIPGVIAEEDAPEPVEEAQPEAPESPQEQPEETAASEEAPAAEESADTPEEPSLQSEPFQFLGKQWESIAKAEEVLGSQEGRITKLNETLRDRDQRLNEYWDYIQAVSKENEELRAQVEQRKPEAEGEASKGKDEDSEWFNNVKLAMQIGQQRGLDPMEVALHAMNQRFEKKLSESIEQSMAKATAPLQQMEEQKAIDTAQRELFLWGQNQPEKYPELARGQVDAEFVKDLYGVWSSLSSQLPPQFAYSGAGFDYAYRLTKDNRPAAEAAAPATGSERPRDEKGRFAPSNGAARAASDMSGTTPRLQGQEVNSVQRALRELGEHKPITRGETNLGFYE